MASSLKLSCTVKSLSPVKPAPISKMPASPGSGTKSTLKLPLASVVASSRRSTVPTRTMTLTAVLAAAWPVRTSVAVPVMGTTVWPASPLTASWVTAVCTVAVMGARTLSGSEDTPTLLRSEPSFTLESASVTTITR